MKKPERLGPYIIGKPIGKGGMGHVYAATHAETNDSVAVKVLSPELASSDGFRERFDAEIKSLRLLRHPQIVRLFGWGEQEGTLFYAMELVEGPSLEEELRAGRRFDWRETTQISIQICRALKNAHDHGIVHRDIKPANVLLAAGDQVKLADFGIARLFGGSQLTIAGGVLGTADFMSPEQADGRPVTDRSDQYSLGCVMYALLAGRPPFKAKTLPEMLQLQRYAEPEPVYRFAPYTPAQLADAINQLLAKEPEQRFPNTLVLAKHLEAMHHALTRPARTGEPIPQEDDFDLPGATGGSANVADFMPTLAERAAREAAVTGVSEAAKLASGTTRDPHPEPAAVSRDAQTVASVSPGSTGAIGEEPRPRPARFTTIAEHSQSENKDAGSPWLIWLQVAAAVLVVASLGYAAWMTNQPRTADDLYNAIMANADSDQPELRSVAAEMDEFLAAFPADQRRSQISELRQQLELQRLARRMRMAARTRGEPRDSAPAEEVLYLEALELAESDPQQAIVHLESLVTVLEILPAAEPTSEEPANEEAEPLVAGDHRAELLALAQQKLGELRDQIEQNRKHELPFLQQSLEAAQMLRGEDPSAAREAAEAIVQLYEHKPWDADEVEQARALLRELAKPELAKPAESEAP